MLAHFLKISLRQFKSQPVINALSVIGIGIGLAGVIVLSIIVNAELSFDRFHSEPDKIFRVTTVFRIDGRESRFAINDGVVDEVLANDVANVQHSTAFLPVGGSLLMRADEKVFKEADGIYVDPDFLKVFDFKTIAGDTNIGDPNTIVLTRTLAMKLFGTTDVIGRILEVDPGGAKWPLKVILLLEDTPINSTIRFDYLISGSTIGESWKKLFTPWSASNSLHIYFKVHNEEPLPSLQAALDTAFYKYKLRGPNYTYLTPLQPLTDVHFNSKNQFEIRPEASLDAFRIYIVLIVSMLIIVTLNGANINSARLVKRIKGIGIWKVFGASKLNIFINCMADMALQNFITFSIALLLATGVIYTLDLSVFSIDNSALVSFITSGYFIGLYVFYSAMTGIYPVLEANSYRIQKSLTGKPDSGSAGYFGFRYVLVTLQVVAATTMVIFSVTIVRQIRHVSEMDLGYERENVIQFRMPFSASVSSINTFKNTLAQSTCFSSTGSCYMELLGLSGMSTQRLTTRDGNGLMFLWNSVDAGFIETMGMQIAEGRGFSALSQQDTSAIIINETARDILNVQVGDDLKLWPVYYQVIGVLKDFNFRGFEEVTNPVVFFLSPNRSNIVLAKYTEGKAGEAVKIATAAWQQNFNDSQVEYSFFDDKFRDLVKKEFQTAYIAIFFSFVTLCIACIGVLGLTAYIAVSQAKMIAIRKIMGATTGDILTLIGKRFSAITIIGSLLAIPVTIMLGNYWLSHFTYKTSLAASDFVLTFVLVTLLVVLVIFRQVLKSSSANPATAIREE